MTTWGEEIRGAAAAQSPGVAELGGGLGWPPGAVLLCRLGQAVGCSPRLPACQDRGAGTAFGAASTLGLGPPLLLPHAWAGHGVSPLHPCFGGAAGPQTQASPPASSSPGVPTMLSTEVLHPGPPARPTQRGGGETPGSPRLRAAFSLLFKDLPGETINSDPKT